MVELDVLILGGGIQGLVLLDQLTRDGYATALVTNSDLGTGQSLHSHGLLNSGMGLLTGQLQQPLGLALAFARARGLTLYGDDRWYVLLPPPAIEQLRPLWESASYEYTEVPARTVPQGLVVDDGVRVFALRGYNFPKRQLIRLLAEDHTDRIIRGDIAATHRSTPEQLVRLDAVDVVVRATGETVGLKPQAVIIAAGTGTKRLVRSVVGAPTEHIERITFTRSHMLCVRAPRDVLPDVNVMSAQHRLISVAHVNASHERVAGGAEDSVTWYVTPEEPEATHHENVPDDAHASVDPQIVARALDALLHLYPPLRAAAEDSNSQIRFAVYAGYKQNVGDQSIVPLCDVIQGTHNVLVAAPSVIANCWSNALRALELIRSRVCPSGPIDAVPAGGQGVRIGNVNELTDAVKWLDWQAMLAGRTQSRVSHRGSA
jgi:FAD dependent oxidoreductase